MTESAAASAVFDLSVASLHDYRGGSRTVQIIFTAGFVLLLAIAVGVIATTPVFFSNLYSIGMASLILVGVGFLCTLAIFMFSPGAVRLEVSATGIRLAYAKGRSKDYRWNDPEAKLTLWLSPPTLPNGQPYPFAQHEIRTLYPLDNPLTQEAFHAVLGSARGAGLEVHTISQSGRGPRTILRIRGKPPS